MSICVIGAGIIGLPTAVYIQENEPNCKVTLIAEEFSPNLTSDIAAGLLRPIYLNDPNTERIKKWCEETFNFVQKLYHEDPIKCGVGLMSGYELFEKPEEKPYWSDSVYGFRIVSKQELDSLGYDKFTSGWFYTTYYLAASKYLKVVLEKFRKNGGTIIQRKLKSLDEIEDGYDVIVNCSGLGSHHLVTDPQCFPIRGQIFRVNAPFLNHFVVTDDHYILLNNDRVILGGTHQDNDWRKAVNSDDSMRIWNGCLKLMPSLKDCTVIDQIVGLRPGRSCIRLELEHRSVNNRLMPVVHCYGHGGSGITLFYGCVQETASLAIKALQRKFAKL